MTHRCDSHIDTSSLLIGLSHHALKLGDRELTAATPAEQGTAWVSNFLAIVNLSSKLGIIYT